MCPRRISWFLVVIVTKQLLERLIIDEAMRAVSLTGDLGGPLVDAAADFRRQRLTLEGMPVHGFPVGFLLRSMPAVFFSIIILAFSQLASRFRAGELDHSASPCIH